MPLKLNPITGKLDLVGLTSATADARYVNHGTDGEGTENLNYVQFETTATPITNAEGLLQWNATDGTLDLGMDGGDITMQVGQEMFIKVRNVSGSTITNGSPVYLSGRTGNRPNIYLAQSNSDTTSKVVGVVTQDIADGTDGFVTTVGYVRQIKTNYSGAGNWGTTWLEGDNLYVSKTIAGQLTNVEPSAPHHSDIIGQVGVVGGVGIGSILVNIDRHITLEQLTDVDGTPLTTTGQVPTWNQTGGYFDFDYNLNNYLKLDASNDPITSDLAIYGNLTQGYYGLPTQIKMWGDGLSFGSPDAQQRSYMTLDVKRDPSNTNQTQAYFYVRTAEATANTSSYVFDMLGDSIGGTPKIMSIRYNGVEKWYVDNSGSFRMVGTLETNTINGHSNTGMTIYSALGSTGGGNAFVMNATAQAGGHGRVLEIRDGTTSNVVLALNGINTTAGNLYGGLGLGTTSPSARLHVVSNAATDKTAIFKGAASQTANLTEWQNSSGTVLSAVDASGRLGIGNSSPQSPLHITGASNSSTPLRIDNVSNTKVIEFFLGGGGAGLLRMYNSDGTQQFNFAGGTNNVNYITGVRTADVSILTLGSTSGIDTGIFEVNCLRASMKGIVIRGNASQSANLQEWQNSSGTVLSVVDENGYLGIGFSNPGNWFSLQPTFNTTGTHIASRFQPTLNTAATALYSTYNNAIYSGVGTLGNLFAFLSIANNTGTGITTNAYGFFSRISSSGATGTITNGYAIYADVPTVTGSITNSYGLYVQNHNVASGLNYAIYTNAGAVRLGDTVQTTGRKQAIAVKSADYTLTTNDEVVIFTATATATLPAATGTGQTYRIVCRAGTTTIDANGSETIKGELSQTLTAGEDLIISDTASGIWE